VRTSFHLRLISGFRGLILFVFVYSKQPWIRVCSKFSGCMEKTTWSLRLAPWISSCFVSMTMEVIFYIYDRFFFRIFHICGHLLWGVSFHYLISAAMNSIFVCNSDENRISVLKTINLFVSMCSFKWSPYWWSVSLRVQASGMWHSSVTFCNFNPFASHIVFVK